MKRSLATAALLLSCLTISAQAQAQGGFLKSQAQQGENAEEPATQILSDTLTYNDATRTSRFTGNVIMTRGPLTLTADQLDMREDTEGYQYGVAIVEPTRRVYIRQENPESFEVLIGLGERAEYDGKEETFDLIDRALLVRYICGKPFDTISGQRVRYEQKSDTYRAFGGPGSDNPQGRVRSVAQPRTKIDAAIEACKQLQAAGVQVPVVPPLQ